MDPRKWVFDPTKAAHAYFESMGGSNTIFIMQILDNMDNSNKG